ncbi:MAG TPA: hypothetical protein VN213_01015 [Solirubrobacteraceae bacterium]|nr:hypothetical protein [Solirubrobacteraceae bacterium]
MTITTDHDTRQSWWRRLLGPVQEPPVARHTLRYAGPDDAEALAQLADLDSSRPPRGVVLLAEVGDELWAAVSLDDGHGVADPFRPSADLLLRIHERARELRRAERGRMERLPRVWPAAPQV